MTTEGRPGLAARLMAILADTGPFGRALAVVVLVATWVATWRPEVDPDFGWHLRIGEGVLDGQGVPHTDPFSWLSAGQPFVAHSWAWDAVLAATFRAAGLMGTTLAGLPVSALAIGLIWVLIGLVAPKVPPLGRALLVALGIVIGLPVWSPRSQVWDVVVVLALVLAWSLWLRRGFRWPLVVVPFVLLVWANVHGGATLVFVACLLALVIANPIGVRWGTWPRRPLGPLVLSSLVAIGALAVNPNGARILGLALSGQAGNAFLPDIAEWQPPAFEGAGFTTFRIVLASIALVAFALRGRRRDPLLLLLAAGWIFLALGAARFSLIAGPLVAIALAPGAGASLTAWTGISLPRHPGPRPAAPRVLALAAWVVALVIGVAGVIQISPARQDSVIAATYPVDAVKALVDSGCRGRLLNAYDWGGFLIMTTDLPVATYGSSPSALVALEKQFEFLEADPQPFLERYGVQVVLMPTGGPLDRWLDATGGWSVMYRDRVATIHKRAGPDACRPTADAATISQIR